MIRYILLWRVAAGHAVVDIIYCRCDRLLLCDKWCGLSPYCDCSCPAMIFSSVVLPHSLGPTVHTNVCSATFYLTSYSRCRCSRGRREVCRTRALSGPSKVFRYPNERTDRVRMRLCTESRAAGSSCPAKVTRCTALLRTPPPPGFTASPAARLGASERGRRD